MAGEARVTETNHASAGIALAHCSSVGTSSHSTCTQQVSAVPVLPHRVLAHRHAFLEQHCRPNQHELQAEVLPGALANDSTRAHRTDLHQRADRSSGSSSAFVMLRDIKRLSGIPGVFA